MLPRTLESRLPSPDGPRRIAVVTGARQVGKTTLARSVYGDGLNYVNLDSPNERHRLNAIPAEGWTASVGPAILDEAHKAPGIFDKLKWAYDEGDIDFGVILGSSRIMLLDQIRETLAGRVFLYELWPLTVAELAPHFGGTFTVRPLISSLVDAPADAPELLASLPPTRAGREVGSAQAAVEHLLTWGGLPGLLEYPDDERWEWLDAYQATYLERDLADLARLRDLDSFIACHKLAALRSGQLLSYSEMARDAGVPVTTTRRYLRYLEISYQTYRLEAWSGNPSVRLIKSPKLIWFDTGVQRSLSGQLSGLTGAQYESAIVGQVVMALETLGLRFESSFLRTSGGLEVDLVLETRAEERDHLLALELKSRRSVRSGDARSIERARRLFGDRYSCGIVVYRGDTVERLAETVWAVPDWWLLGLPSTDAG